MPFCLELPTKICALMLKGWLFAGSVELFWFASHMAAKRCANLLTFAGSWKSEMLISFDNKTTKQTKKTPQKKKNKPKTKSTTNNSALSARMRCGFVMEDA